MYPMLKRTIVFCWGLSASLLPADTPKISLAIRGQSLKPSLDPSLTVNLISHWDDHKDNLYSETWCVFNVPVVHVLMARKVFV